MGDMVYLLNLETKQIEKALRDLQISEDLILKLQGHKKITWSEFLKVNNFTHLDVFRDQLVIASYLDLIVSELYNKITGAKQAKKKG